MNLKETANEIKELLYNRQKEIDLSFIEDTHTYYMRDIDGNIKSNFLSVSTILKSFYNKFIAENTQAFINCNGDKQLEKELLDSWALSGTYSTSMGSRVHYLLEQSLVSKYGSYKQVRQPIFECDDTQIRKGDAMVKAGNKYIDLMHERGAILIDTEILLGDNILRYTGQPDKVWIILSKSGVPGLLITDWKTNKPEKMVPSFYTKKMLEPFTYLDDTALSHYFIQLPLYARLILKMLENTKYADIKLLGCVVVHLNDNEEYTEYKTPMNVIETVLTMDLKKYVKNLA